MQEKYCRKVVREGARQAYTEVKDIGYEKTSSKVLDFSTRTVSRSLDVVEKDIHRACDRLESFGASIDRFFGW